MGMGLHTWNIGPLKHWHLTRKKKGWFTIDGTLLVDHVLTNDGDVFGVLVTKTSYGTQSFPTT